MRSWSSVLGAAGSAGILPCMFAAPKLAVEMCAV